MADDAVFNIVIGVQNRERIKQLEKDIEDAEKEIVKLSAAINTAGQATQQQGSQLRMYGRDIQAYRQEITELSKANIDLGEASDGGLVGVRGMIRGIRGLAEGTEGVVSALPMLATMLGANSQLATGIGVVSELVVELHKHWEDLKNSFLDRHGIDAAKTSMEDLANVFRDTPVLGGLFEALSRRQVTRDILEKRNAEVQEARERMGEQLVKEPSEEQERRGKAFQRAVKEYGGERLLNEAVSTQISGKNLTPNQIEEVRKRITNAMGQAAQGKMPEGIRAGIFGNRETEFGQELAFQEAEIAQKDLVKEAKEIAANEKKIKETAKKQLNERVDALNKEGEANEKRFFREEEGALQAQLTQLERQKRDMAEYAREHPEPKYGIIHGGREIAESIQTDLLNQIPKQQLEVQKAIQAGIDQVRDELMDLRLQGFEARAGG